MLLGVAGYTMICFMFNMLDELTPIFGGGAHQPRRYVTNCGTMR